MPDDSTACRRCVRRAIPDGGDAAALATPSMNRETTALPVVAGAFA